MKDGRTHLAHKAEHVVDLDTGAIVAVTVQETDGGDSASSKATLQEALDVIADVMEDAEAAAALGPTVFAELVADKGYHSNEVLQAQAELGIRTYISEPRRGKRRWRGKAAARAAVYANRRRMRGERGKRLSRRRGEYVERGFAHCYDTGGMRRLQLRGQANIRKRVVVHTAAFNLGLMMRKILGRGTPRGLADLLGRLCARLTRLHAWRNATPRLLATLSDLARASRQRPTSISWA